MAQKSFPNPFQNSAYCQTHGWMSACDQKVLLFDSHPFPLLHFQTTDYFNLL